MFDEFVHETAARPPDAARQAGTDHVTTVAVAVACTDDRTAVVRILDKHDVYLHITTTAFIERIAPPNTQRIVILIACFAITRPIHIIYI